MGLIPFGSGHSPNSAVIEFTLPGAPSIISKDGKKSALMIPNSNYLVDFIGGDIGISDNMQKGMMYKNMNSPTAAADEMVFRSFAQTSKIELDGDISKYKKSNGKLTIPKDDIKISPENDLIGLKGLEVTALKSIFETQKPYMEIAKLVIENLAKLEDITARIMPLLGTPLIAKSKKPSGNPNAVGYNGGAIVKAELAKIKSIQNKGGSIKVGPNGTIIRDSGDVSGSGNGGTNSGTDGAGDNNNWEIISAIYSTGKFYPDVDYKYKYIDLPTDLGLGIEDSYLDIDNKDPYSKYRPKTIILGIFDSKGVPLNPLSKIKSIDNQGNKVNTKFNKVGWILDSPKWVFNGSQFSWPVFSSPTYLNDGYPDYNTIYYTDGETNLLNGEKAIPGTPKIAQSGISEASETEYRNYFMDLMNIKLLDIDELTQSERNQIASDIVNGNPSNGMEGLNIKSHIENITNWGQSKSSIYNKIPIPQSAFLQNGPLDGLEFSKDDPYPSAIKKSFKPMKIYSNAAASDEKLLAYTRSQNKPDSDAGWIWIDPESDYVTKVIRIDPTTKITYAYAQGQPEISSEIKSFVKNVATFQISDNREFNVELSRSVGITDTNGNLIYSDFDSAENITSYDLENWNYIDNDGLVVTFGSVNNEPTLNNSNSFKLSMWGNTPTPYYNTGLNAYVSAEVDGYNLLVDEVESVGGEWFIKNISYDLSGTSGLTSLTNQELSNFYKGYKTNPNFTISVSVTVTSGTGASASTSQSTQQLSAANVFANPTDETQNGLRRLGDDTLVEIFDTKIIKWFYMSPSDSNGYGNGNLDELPPNGIRRTFVIDVNTIGNDNPEPLDTNTDVNTPEFQIRVKDDDSTGRIIDPSKVLNSHLTSSDPFSLGKYGHGSNVSPQNIDIIKRYMLTELDTESYYIIEGVLPEDIDGNGIYTDGTLNSNSSLGNSSPGSGYYKLPDAIGSIKVFLSVLGDIFGKLIPTIIKTISLFKNPASFVTTIISEQMKDGFIFASDSSTSAFSEGKLKQNIPNGGDVKVKKRVASDLVDFFKSTTLSNFVFVRDDAEFGSVLDGIAGIPFSIFGASIPFGMEMDFSKIPGSPINLAYPSKINRKNSKNLQSFVSPKRFDDTNASNLAAQINEANNPPKVTDVNFNPNESGDRTDGKSNTKTKIDFEDGSSIFIDDGSVDDFIVDNKSRYNFVYVTEQTKSQLAEADDLIETGTPENIKKALGILDDIGKRNPNNKEIDLKKDSAKKKLDKIESGEQPLLKFILGLVTLPIKIIGGIIEWIMEFFKKMTNPMKLPSLIAEFLSFSWIMDFFSPTGLLEMIGIKIKPQKIVEWASKAGSTLAESDLADLNEFLSLAFGVKLPTFTKEQFTNIVPDMPLRLVKALFCFIEKLINGIIDFVWSTLGIEAIIPPPHIKLCSDSDTSSMTPEEISKVLNGVSVGGDTDGDGVLSEAEKNAMDPNSVAGFYYEIELPGGEKKQFLDRVSLDSFIEDNKGLNYDFTF